ncbi:uracil-DNA glycosylase family protein [Lacibacter sediminis]|uniref:Uracil-DNA glycosylase family protein n=1 Tax=Lacibacter sediminis TaxID=2760713 RepID=A0A7G5XLW5_9BACT|nr:hypothetical protein [Lacibacter sediminis]QNA46468.1 hypothetical protein H4075_09940 [Lacibacter sediminis]
MKRGRPRKHQSWDNRVETHPWKRFPEIDNDATQLILGSFPPNKFTDYPNRLSRCDEQFFYGSKDNAFWDLFIVAKDLALRWPDHLEGLKNWLSTNKWIISDILLTTTRKKDSATDSDLVPVKWNTEVINRILTNNPIQTILFTSNWVKNKFDQEVKKELSAFTGSYREVVLISPSPAGLISTEWAKKELPILDGEDLESYRQRYYQWALNEP